LLLDEFDAVAKLRDDHQELGELKRVVNSFIQNLDVLGRDLILIAATNHEQLLDPAVWRRFQHLLYVGLPDLNQREHLWELYSGDLGWSPKQLKVLADLSDGFSGASIQAVSTKLRQRVITHEQPPSLREAVTALLFMARGEASGKNPVDASVLDDLPKLTKLLQSRNSGIYSLAIVGELAGCSRATMSRLSSAGRKRRSKANASRTPIHQSHTA
jgi:SpoVK/Ycf46/Vps4 family AAA+-type ATPase